MDKREARPLRIGVLALQGAFVEHVKMLERLGIEAREVRLPADLQGLGGLIIPGGESTTIGKLASLYGLMNPLRDFARRAPVWGTCAGMIFMAREIGRHQPLLGVMDIEVERNAFGRQVDSFETDLEIAGISAHGNGFPAVFIRAPRLVDAGEEVEILATLEDGTAVAARQGQWLVTSFHPELTDDLRLHAFFAQMVADAGRKEPAG